MYLKDLDQSRMAFPKLKELLRDQMEAGVVTFNDLKSTQPNPEDLPTYGYVRDDYVFNYPIQKVFDHYKYADPNVAWGAGGLVAFGLALDKNTHEVYYPGESYPGAKVGQVFYIHCTIFGLKRICMSQEIVKVDDQGKEIVFSYIEGGMTAGIQEIKFTELGSNQTRVTHISNFKGVSPFRDKFYPFFHSLIVGKFHGNLKSSLELSEN